jgi:spermidine/putrescine transport system permease protein
MQFWSIALPGKRRRMRRRKSGTVWMILPLYIFTLIFVAAPLLYMIALSFATPGETHGVVWSFSLNNYKKILDPVYLNTFAQSFQLAITSTLAICLMGYPFGYFMAKLSNTWKKRAMTFLMLPFWVNSLIRLYGWIIILQTKGILNFVLKKLGIIDKPLKLLYSYPAIVVGMVYVLLPFMILSVYSSAEKLDWSLVEAARDLGASRFQAFVTVSFRLTLPGLLSGIILTFIPSMGLFFIADILGGNKIVLVGSLIQEQMTRGNNWPFAAALAVIMMALTTAMIAVYRKITNVKELEGIG